MKLTKIEKTVIGVILFLLLFITVSVHSCNILIQDKGGMHQIIVEAGKEIKSIKQEIKE